MKHLNSILIVLLGLATIATAQTDKKTQIMFNGGLSLPMGGDQPSFTNLFGTIPFSDGWSGGFSFGAGFSYSFTSQVALVVSFDYSNFPINEDNFINGTYNKVEGGEITSSFIAANIKYSMGQNIEKISPYLLAGFGGLGFSDIDVTLSGPGITSNTKITREGIFQDAAAVAGGGVDIPAGNAFAIFIEGKFVIGLVDGIVYFPIKAGFAFKI